MKKTASKPFKNGIVFRLETDDSFTVEVTDTFLSYYTMMQ